MSNGIWNKKVKGKRVHKILVEFLYKVSLNKGSEREKLFLRNNGL